MRIAFLPIIFVLSCIITIASSFVSHSTKGSRGIGIISERLSLLQKQPSSTATPSQLQLSPIYPDMDPDQAASQFWFFFFAGSGAGGIGLGQVPKILDELKLIRELAAQGPTEGGKHIAALANSPIYGLFYPKQPALTEADVRKVILKAPSAAQINQLGSSTSFFAAKGYIIQDDFIEVLSSQKYKCNPLAAYAAFEAVSGGGSKCVAPDQVDDKLAAYRQADAATAIQLFANDVQGAILKKMSAYATLLFLLLITLDLIVETGIQAFL